MSELKNESNNAWDDKFPWIISKTETCKIYLDNITSISNIQAKIIYDTKLIHNNYTCLGFFNIDTTIPAYIKLNKYQK
jgi:hypothetical protein